MNVYDLLKIEQCKGGKSSMRVVIYLLKQISIRISFFKLLEKYAQICVILNLRPAYKNKCCWLWKIISLCIIGVLGRWEIILLNPHQTFLSYLSLYVLQRMFVKRVKKENFTNETASWDILAADKRRLKQTRDSSGMFCFADESFT